MDLTGYNSCSSEIESQSPRTPDHSQKRSFSNTEGMDNPYIPLLYTPSRREPTSTRWSTTFLSSILVFVLLNCLITAEAILSTYQTQFASDPPLAALTSDYPLIDDNHMNCTSLGPSPKNVHRSLPTLPPWESVEFDVPITAAGLFVVSRGSLSSGVVRIHQSPDVNDLRISVSAYSHKREALSSARVCLVEHERGNGVAILTPFRWIPPRRKDALFFIVDVMFPSPTHGTRDVSSFVVDVPEFKLHVEGLSGYSFGTFALKSTNKPVTVASVSGNLIGVEGKNGKIDGSFNATGHLKLLTTNAPINASINAHSILPDKPTVISVKTSNGLLNSNVSLSTNTSSGTGGNFRVYTHTSNSVLGVTFASSPPNSHLTFEGTTKNAPARVALHAAFEGGFLLATTQFRPTLHVLPDVKDPTGRGRKRKVEDRVVAGRAVIGNVSWVVPPGEGPVVDGAGWASVITRNAPVMLVL